MQSCLQRIAEVNPKLNAVGQLAADTELVRVREADDALARGENWGALHGVPMTIKDSLDTAGVAAIVTCDGTPFDIGCDYGGSIRLPTHFCGVAGSHQTCK